MTICPNAPLNFTRKRPGSETPETSMPTRRDSSM